MKLEVQKFWLFCVILVLYVNFVHAQFAKGVIKNNVFTYYVNNTSSGSKNTLNLNQNTSNIGYFINNLNTTMTTPLSYNTQPAIKPTTSVHKSSYRLKKPHSSPWNQSTKPVIAYTLPPNMKLKLENAVRQGQLGSRSRSTKMHTATTPAYESTDINGIIIKNFIHHLSTTKANIESTIPNPNQFYTTPSTEGSEMEPLVIMNANKFFPGDEMSVDKYGYNIENEQGDDENPPIVVSGSTNFHNPPSQYNQQNPIKTVNSMDIHNSHSTSTYTERPQHAMAANPIITQISQVPSKHQKVRHPNRKGSPQVPNPSLHTPTRRRPVKVSNVQSVQNNKQQAVKTSPTMNSKVKVPSTVASQQSMQISNQTLHIQTSVNVPSTMVSQQINLTQNSGNTGSFNSLNQSIQSQHQDPVILAPSKENSLNIFNAMSTQQVFQPSYSIAANSMNALNPVINHQPMNQVINQQVPQMFNSIPLQTYTGNPYGNLNHTLHQSVMSMTPDSPTNRPNNSLKQLQLQFLLDCSLLDPQTKTRIPLGTNPVGDDFFFTPMPFINQNPPQVPINIKQAAQISLSQQNPYNPFNPLNYLPSFPSLFPTTQSPLATILLTDSTTAQTTPQPIYVSVQPNKRRHKKKVKNVYVDLPIVSEVGNMLDRVYNFMEESLVTKVVKKTETQPARRVQVAVQGQGQTQTQVPQVIQISQGNQASFIGDNSDEDYLQRYTTPYYRTTRSRKNRPKKRRPIASTYYTNRLPSNNWQPMSYHRQKRTTLVPNYGSKGDRNKNYLTTKIHVTSEYNGPNPTDSIDYDDRRKVTESSEEEEDYYYDSFTLPEFSFDSYDDDDDDDDNNNSVQKYESAQSSSKNKIKIKRKNSKQATSGSTESDSYEDDGNDDSPSMFGDFFGNVGNVFSSMNKYVPSFKGYMPSLGSYLGGGSGSKEIDYNTERSTTPKIETRNPKNPKYIFSDYTDYNGIDDPSAGGSWYNPFYYGTYDSPVPTTEASNDYWNWFGNSNENTETVTEYSVTNQNNSGWFFGLFGNSEETKPSTTTTTTTKRPFLTVDFPMYKPQNWLGILANHIVANKPSNHTPIVPQKVSYDNYQLWRLMPESEDQVKFLEEYRTTPEGAKLQWWKGPTLRGPTDIVLPPTSITDVKISLDYEEIPHEVIIWDLEKAIKFENPPMSRREQLEMEITQEHPLSWYRYHRYNDIVKFLEYLQRKFSNSVELIHIGRSFEGRPLIVTKVSAPPLENVNWKGKEKKKKKANRRSIFIESGTHAREWIAPAVATWILDKLVRNLNNSDSLGETIRSVDWYIMPVLNPDGYEYSHLYDRLWRKTRSKHKEEASLFSNALNWLRKEKKDKEEVCYGTDLNRNWNHNWNEKGSSKSECNEFYAGPKAFSEPEIRALSKFLEEHKKNFKVYLSLHSYGQIISYPSRANASYNSIKSDDLLDMAQVALETLRGSGTSTRYMVDNTNEMMHARSGSSDLYTMYDLGIKYSYTMELRDSGTHGFLLPPSNIDSTAKETFEIIKGMVDYI